MRVGSEPIASLVDTTERANAVNAAWPFVRRELLRSHSWNILVTRVSITADATAPTWGWDSRYAVPADSLRIIDVDTSYQWRVEGDWIVTDGTGDLDVTYLIDETDPAELDATLTELLVMRLAIEIVERITDSTTKRGALLQEYDRMLSEAMALDSQEQSASEFEEDKWITARY